MQTKIFAHRGASKTAAENTMEAFEAAIKQGADGIELDIQKSKDDQILVSHDENLKRVTLVDRAIAETDYAEIKKLNAAAFRPDDQPAYVPLLEEVLDLVKPTNLEINIELKNSLVLYPRLEEDCLALVKKFGMEDRIVFSSFNHYSIMKLLALGTKSEVAFLYLEGLYQPWLYANNNQVQGLHPYYPNLMIPDYIKESHALGVKVRPWTVDDEAMMKKLLALEVDAIITNIPAPALAIRDAQV